MTQATQQGRTGNGRADRPGYEKIEPLSNYAPWSTTPEFLRVFEQIKENTLVDIYRCYMLWQLVGQAVAHPGDLLEVGAWRGGSGALIASRAARAARGEEPRAVYLADTFRGVVKAGAKDDYYKGGEHANTSPLIVQELLDRLNLGNVILLEGIFPEDTAAMIEERRFCFCHIDVDVYQSAKDVLEWVWPRMVVGGIVVYDDYGFYGCEGVTRHVEEEYPRSDRVTVHNLSGQAVVVKTA